MSGSASRDGAGGAGGAGGGGGGWAPGGWAPRGWAPPLAVLVHLAWAALEGQGGQDGTAGEVLWIGRRVWPYPYTLVREGGRDRRLLARSLFVDPDRDASRLWAIDLALRCPGVAAVVADGHGLRMPETRRLQLAARSGDALALLARPPGERRRLSAASTRWAVRAEPSPGPTPAPRWNLRLLRSKDVPRAKQEPRSWSLEWDHAKSALVVPPVLVLGPRKKTAAPRRRTPAREHACARQPA